jgi:pantoate--beta-alanine ligase
VAEASPKLVTVATVAELRRAVAQARSAGKKVGLVPTMGALHAGHASLIAASAEQCGFTVATIFVNPTQFAPNEDFQKYPRPLDADLAIAAAHGADLVFLPAQAEVYPPGFDTYVEMHGVTETLEGQFRPAHFRGVATVVLKLLLMAGADVAYFGQKDYQQTLVVRKLVRDFNVPVEICVRPTLREADGLAMSSRNIYLSPVERKQALALSRSLEKARAAVAAGERDMWRVRDAMQSVLAAEKGVRVQYAVVADAETLAEPARIERPCVALVAAFVGTTRLIDNMLLEPAG